MAIIYQWGWGGGVAFKTKATATSQSKGAFHRVDGVKVSALTRAKVHN